MTILDTEVVETNFNDIACSAGSDQDAIDQGTMAPDDVKARSVYTLFLVMAFLSFVMYKVLDARRSSILSEVFSKLTILQKK